MSPFFDRYGKLIKSLNGKEIEWDGYYQGAPLPTNDYWVLIKIGEKTIKDHITLIR